MLGIDRETGGSPIPHVLAARAGAAARSALRRAAAAAAPVLLLALGGAPGAGAAESAPSVTTGTSSEIALTRATLSGSVAGPLPLTGCWFEWGIPPHFEHSSSCSPEPGGGSAMYVTGEATGLQFGTTYGWRLSASDALGASHGEPGAFTTLGYPTEGASSEPAQPVALIEGPPSVPAITETPLAHGRIQDGLYVAYCPIAGESRPRFAGVPRAGAAVANHTGWPALQCLKMDKGTYGHAHTLVGQPHVHNWLLGGYGNDTIWAGREGDVIWGDYQPSRQSRTERDVIHGGPGVDWIYSSHGHSEIWTGAGDDHLALVYGWGTIHCNGPGMKTLVMRLLPRNRHWRLDGCRHIRIEPYRA